MRRLPRLKQPEVKFSRLQKTLRAYALNGTKIAPVLKVSPVTARKRMKDPQLFTVKDLDVLSRHFGIPWEEIRESIVR